MKISAYRFAAPASAHRESSADSEVKEAGAGRQDVTGRNPSLAHDALLTAVANSLRVGFIIGALGTGVAIPAFLLRVRNPQ